MNVELRDRVVDALNGLAFIQVVRDDVIPGCAHFGDRVIVHFKVLDQSGWAAQRRFILKKKNTTKPAINLHMCQQFVLNESGDKEELLLVNTIEIEGTEATVEALISILKSLSKIKIDSKLPQTSINTGFTEGRVPDTIIKSKKLSISDINGR
jgi:hypothetical protein